MIETRVLQGGSTALIETVPGTRTLSMGFWFPFGSRHEGHGRRGYTHYIEHMLFKGTARRSAAGIAREIDRIGGYLNAFTEREAVCFYCTLPAERMDTALDILMDMVFDSTFPEAEFNKERNVILNEILTAQDDPEDISFDEYLASIWPDHDMSAKIAGEAEDVRAIRLDGIKTYHEEWFVPSNLVISVAGAFEKEQLISSLDRSLDKVCAKNHANGRNARLPPKGSPPEYKKTNEYRKAAIQQVQLYAGLPFDPVNTVEEYTRLSVFNCAFGESMGSRLFQNIREALGYCYSVYSFFSLASDAGLWTVNGSSSERHFKPFLESVMDEARKVARDGLTTSEIEDAILHLEGTTIMASEDMEHRMKRLARQYLQNGSVLSVDESIGILRRVDSDSVNDMARKVVRPEDMSVFAYGAKRKSVSGFKKTERPA